jgi:drug/metabolite transporter (DMT)-like permease
MDSRESMGGPAPFSPRRQLPDLPWQASFVVVAATWGASFMFIKVGLEALAPLQVAFVRTALGAATLLAIVLALGDRLPRGREVWLHLFVAALFLNAAPFALYAEAETRVSSVLAGIWNAMTPLLALLVALVALPEERPTRERVAGLALGFIGVLIVLGPWRGLGGDSLAGNLMCLAAAACYGIAFPYTRRFLSGRPESAVSISAGQVLAGSALGALLLPFAGAAPGGIDARVVLCMIGLGALGTGIAYILNFEVIRKAGATTASAVTYLIPIFSTVFGVVLLGEDLSWNEPVGAAVIIAGVAVAQGAALRRRARI